MNRSLRACLTAATVVAALALPAPHVLASGAPGIGVNQDVTVDYGTNATVETVVPYEFDPGEIGDYLSPPPDDRINARCALHAGVTATYDSVADGYAIFGRGDVNCAASDVAPIDISMNVTLTKNGSAIESGAIACSAAAHCATVTDTYHCQGSACAGTYRAYLVAQITWVLPLRRIPSHCTKTADNQLNCSVTSFGLTLRAP